MGFWAGIVGVGMSLSVVVEVDEFGVFEAQYIAKSPDANGYSPLDDHEVLSSPSMHPADGAG